MCLVWLNLLLHAGKDTLITPHDWKKAGRLGPPSGRLVFLSSSFHQPHNWGGAPALSVGCSPGSPVHWLSHPHCYCQQFPPIFQLEDHLFSGAFPNPLLLDLSQLSAGKMGGGVPRALVGKLTWLGLRRHLPQT